jgi:hypothetical protein
VSISAKGMYSQFEALYLLIFLGHITQFIHLFPNRLWTSRCAGHELLLLPSGPTAYALCHLFLIEIFSAFVLIRAVCFDRICVYSPFTSDSVTTFILFPVFLKHFTSSFDSLNLFKLENGIVLTQSLYFLRRFDSRSKCMRIC